ncbi:hypothetical protein ACHQM5_002332 [Ranunculus cassubicifolius]
MVSEKKLIIDQVSCWLQVFNDGTADRSWTGPPEYEFMVKPVPSHDTYIDGVATRDVMLDSNSGVSVRIYLPELTPDEISSKAKFPVVLHFHGGGFCISRPDWYMYYAVYTRLARKARAIFVSVYMRLAPEHRLPAAFDDAYSALLWLRSLARKESSEPWLDAKADFTRVFLIGDSSGGNVVHQVAARAGEEEWFPMKLAGGIPIHPGFMRSERSESESQLQYQTPFLTLEMLDKFMSFSLPIGSTKDHPFTCPMGAHAPPLGALNLPPFMVVVAEHDLMKDTEMEYCEAMKKAGKNVEVFFNQSIGHSFYLNKAAVDMDPHTGDQTERLFSAITDFINRH